MRTQMFCLALMVGGCVESDVAQEDAQNDSFVTDGKADGSIAEGSPTAIAVLSIVNHSTETQLHSDVGLSTKAAHNIATHNGTFDTLADLDAVPYVGSIVFGKLVAYAKATGLIEDTHLAKGTLLDCNISFGVDQQATVLSDGTALTLRELTDSGSQVDRTLSLAEWNSEKLALRADEFGSMTTLTKDGSDWVVRETGGSVNETGTADCWVDKSN
jgi:hypothetical protein